MEISWKEFCTWMELLAHAKLRGIDSVAVNWTFDDSRGAGFLGIGLHRFAGDKQAWVRFRERAEGVFYQINDAPWKLIPALDAETAGQIFEAFIVRFEGRHGRDPVPAANSDRPAQVREEPPRFAQFRLLETG